MQNIDDKGKLWFDVGIKRYTTRGHRLPLRTQLWFDVGIKRYYDDRVSVLIIQAEEHYNDK